MADIDAIRAGMSDVKDDSTDTHWVVAKGNDTMKGLVLVATGTGGIEEFLQALDGEEAAPTFGVVRIRAVDDRGTVKSVRAKFVRVNRVPDAMPVMKKAKAGALKAQADDLFSGTHSSFDVSSAVAELTRQRVTDQLQATCGAHRPSHYDFDGKDGETAHIGKTGGGGGRKAPDEGGRPYDTPPIAYEMAKAAADAPPPAPETPATPASPAGPAGEDEVRAAIKAAWDDIHADATPTNWLVIAHEDPKKVSSAKIVATGSGGLEEMKEALDDDSVMYAGLRVTAIDDRGTVRSIRAKYIFVQFIGAGVKPIQRAQAGPQKATFMDLLSNCHINVSISKADELQAEPLKRQLLASGGAHAPNSYDFGKIVLE